MTTTVPDVDYAPSSPGGRDICADHSADQVEAAASPAGAMVQRAPDDSDGAGINLPVVQTIAADALFTPTLVCLDLSVGAAVLLTH